MIPSHGDCHVGTGLVKFAGPAQYQRTYASSSPTSYKVPEHGINDRGVVPDPSEGDPVYAFPFTCEDGNWACEKNDRKSEQKHVVQAGGMVEM
jgi:hypothetical protein